MNLSFELKTLKNKVWQRLNKASAYRTDWVTPACMLLLGITSVFFIFSAQSYAGGNQWKAQIMWLGISAVVYFIVSSIDYKIYMKHAHIVYALSLLLLLMLWTPLGINRFGATRWLNFKVFSLQPSEAAKIGTLILASSIIARSPKKTIAQSLNLIKSVGITFSIPILLIFLQPDLGSSLVFPPMIFALLYVAQLQKRFFITILTLFILGVGLVSWDIYQYNSFLQKNNLGATTQLGAYEKHSFMPLKDYQRNRILSFAAPEVVDPKGIGVSWNLRQSLISVGSGGLTGQGHNKGTQAKLGYLPQSVATNDFIFSVIAEESGFIGSASILLIFSVIILNGLRIASIARDEFGALLCTGVSTILITHVFINVGMTLGIMPITGLSLPFLSYGGSFILSCCILQGFIQSVYRFRRLST